jgi:hypothetical protein
MMKKNTFFLISFLVFISFVINGQEYKTATNNLGKSIKVWRTTNNLEEVIAFPVQSFTVPKNTTKYLHMMVNFAAQPDIAISIDAQDKNSNGNFSNIIRPLNSYKNFNRWENLVFPISGGENGIEVNTILIYPDLGIKNEPVGQILNNTGMFGYIDELILKDYNTLSIESIKNKESDVLIYPNPSVNSFNLSSPTQIIKVSIYSNLGKEVTKNVVKLKSNKYEISHLSKGIYFIKTIDEKGFTQLNKLIKK